MLGQMLPWGSLSGDCDLEADLELEKAGMAVAEKSEAFRLDPPEFVVGLGATPPLGVSPRPVGPRPGSAALAALRAPLGHTRPGEVLPGDRCARWEELPPVPAPASLQVRLGLVSLFLELQRGCRSLTSRHQASGKPQLPLLGRWNSSSPTPAGASLGALPATPARLVC